MRLQKYEKYFEYLAASRLFFIKLSENLYGWKKNDYLCGKYSER